MTEKKKLNIDFDALLPGKIFTIGTQDILITPLDVTRTAYITKKIRNIIPLFIEQGITLENYNTVSNLLTITEVLMMNAPDILSELLDIEEKDVIRLPLSIACEGLAIALEVNLEAKESLTKNFNRIIETIVQILPKEEKKK